MACSTRVPRLVLDRPPQVPDASPIPINSNRNSAEYVLAISEVPCLCRPDCTALNHRRDMPTDAILSCDKRAGPPIHTDRPCHLCGNLGSPTVADCARLRRHECALSHPRLVKILGRTSPELGRLSGALSGYQRWVS